MSNFPKFHGINLAANSAIENLSLELLAADPTPIAAGRLWYNSSTRVIKYSSLNAGGAVIVEVIASGSDVSAVISDLQALGVRVTALEGSVIKKDGSVAFTADQSMGGFKLTNLADGVAASDAATLGQVDSKIAALGNAFEYVGVVEGGADAGSAFNLSTLSQTLSGDYYKVSVAGYFKVGAGAAFYANIGDGLVFNTTGGVDKIDNTDSNVLGTASFIAVTGSADTGFTVDIDQPFKDRVSTLESGLGSETTARQNADAALDTRLTTAEGNISTLQAASSSTNTALAAEVTRAQAAESTISGNLAAEVTRATAAEGTLTTDLAAEVTRATAAEGTLTTNLAAEVTRAQAAEGTLTTNLAAEVTRATAAESAIDTKVGALTSLTTTDKTSIVNAINEVKAAAGGGTDALRVKINDQRFCVEAAAPALTHVITHNLNTGYANVDIRVKGDDGVYRNDIVGFEETSANAITVYLTEARIIKVTVQAMDDIAA